MSYQCFFFKFSDENKNGRQSDIDDKIKIKTVSDSPEIRNLDEGAGGGGGSASESDDGTTNSSTEAGSSYKTASASTGTSASATNNLNDCKKLSNNCTSCCAKK